MVLQSIYREILLQRLQIQNGTSFQHFRPYEDSLCEETGSLVTAKRRWRAMFGRNYALPSDRTILKWHRVLMTVATFKPHVQGLAQDDIP